MDLKSGAKLEIEIPHVHKKRRGQKWRYYFRRAGFKRVRLPGEPGSREFMAAYASALAAAKPVHEPPHRPDDKTLIALIDEYRRTHQYRKLKASTRRETEYVLKKMEAANGPMPVADIDTVVIGRAMDSMTSGAANKWFRVMRPLMKLGKLRKYYAGDNPCEGIKELEANPYRAWTEEEHAAFETFWPIGSRERLGYALCYYTTQRLDDVTEMTWAKIIGDHMMVKQKKQKKNKPPKEIKVPIHPELAPVLAAVHPRYETAILTTLDGKKMSPIHFGSLMADAITKAGLPDDCVLHGLRKSGSKAMAESDCTTFQIASITGHETTRMVEHYTKDRDREKLANDAIRKWGDAVKKKRTGGVNE